MTGFVLGRFRSALHARVTRPATAKAIATTMAALAWPVAVSSCNSVAIAIARLEANVAAASSRERGKPRMTRMATKAGMAVRAAAAITDVVIGHAKTESMASRAREAAATRPVAETWATCQGAWFVEGCIAGRERRQ
jgi:hypothetical protein